MMLQMQDMGYGCCWMIDPVIAHKGDIRAFGREGRKQAAHQRDTRMGEEAKNNAYGKSVKAT